MTVSPPPLTFFNSDVFSLLADWMSKCAEAYKQALEGLTPEQKKAFEQAVFEELDGIAEDPERVRTPAARMKTAIEEARKVCPSFY